MLGLNLKKKRKAEIFLHGFIGIVNECKRRPNKLWLTKEDFTTTLFKNG